MSSVFSPSTVRRVGGWGSSVLLALAAVLWFSPTLRPPPAAPPTAAAHSLLGKLPLYFIENHGQLDSQVAYSVHERDTQLYFTAQGATMVLSAPAPKTESPEPGLRPSSTTHHLCGSAMPCNWTLSGPIL